MSIDYENALIAIQHLKADGQSVGEVAAKMQLWGLPFTTAQVIEMYYTKGTIFYMFQIHSELVSLNKYIQAERTNRFIAANMKEKCTKICTDYARGAMYEMVMVNGKQTQKSRLLPLPNRKYNIIMEWTFTNRKTDPDNFYAAQKFILDGLVKSGMLANDGCNNIGFIFHDWQIGKKFNIKVKLFFAS